MLAGETVEAAHQPARGEDGRYRDGQAIVVPPLRQGHRLGELLDAIGQAGEHGQADFRRHEALARALEYLVTELALGLDHLLADGADRHAEFVGRCLDEPSRPTASSARRPFICTVLRFFI